MPRPLIPAGAYVLDTAQSRVTVRAASGMLSNVILRFSSVHAELDYDPSRPPAAQRLNLKVNPKSLSTGTPLFDSVLRSSQFLDVETFTVIRFTSQDVLAPTTQSKGRVAGNLSLHGVTRPVTFDIAFTDAPGLDADGWLRVTATTVVDRRDFGMKKMRPVVSDRVTFEITAALRATGG